MTWLDGIHVGDCRDLMRRMASDGVRVNDEALQRRGVPTYRQFITGQW